jgi:2-polyprenyl-3-methyl-5-hydroxy-6-metoxy-1,4-benzoquinol methylase
VSTTTTINPPLPDAGTPSASRCYWEQRARQFAQEGDGLGAVCSYGMPGFYNRYIHLVQHRALSASLPHVKGARVLDVGCGVGRWSRQLAKSGALVTGVDLSDTMIAEARRRAYAEGLGQSCQFAVADLAELELGAQFDLILGVTVLQHIKTPSRLDAALQRLVRHLEIDGRMVLLEVAPPTRTSRCDTGVFVAREEAIYREAFSRHGLRILEIRGVDPAPFKSWLLPWYRRMPRSAALAALAAVTAASLPIDALLANRFSAASWHKIFVLERSCA